MSCSSLGVPSAPIDMIDYGRNGLDFRPILIMDELGATTCVSNGRKHPLGDLSGGFVSRSQKEVELKAVILDVFGVTADQPAGLEDEIREYGMPIISYLELMDVPLNRENIELSKRLSKKAFRGEITARQGAEAIAKQSGVPINEDKYKSWMKLFRPERNKEAFEIIGQLEASGRQVAFYSNAVIEQADSIKQFVGDGRRVFISSEGIGSKDNPASYARVVDKMGLEPRQVITFDDNPTNVISARLAGLPAVYTPTTKMLAKETTYRGLLK